MKRILASLDGSSHSDSVLAAAIDLARAHRAKLVLFRAIGIPPEIPNEWNVGTSTLAEFLEAKAKTYLEACGALVPAELFEGHRTFVQIASPWQGICEAATRENADVIVIGSHSYGGLDRWLGTTAAKVVNHAACSVFVVRNVSSATPK